MGWGAQDQGLDRPQSQNIANDLRRCARDARIKGAVQRAQPPQGCQHQQSGEGPVAGLQVGQAGRCGLVLQSGAAGEGGGQQVECGAAGGKSDGNAGFGHTEPPARFWRPRQLAFRIVVA